MKYLKFALALSLITCGAPCFADDAADAVEEVKEIEQELEAVNEPSELKDLISAMKQDRCVNKDQVQRLKKLIKEKGWGKNQQDKLKQFIEEA